MKLSLGQSTAGPCGKTLIREDVSPVEDVLESISDSVTTTSDSDSSMDTIDEMPCGKRHSVASIEAEKLSPNTLLVFDYDDTLFPTSFLAQRGYRLDGPDPTPELKEILEDYSTIVRQTLDEARKLGKVIILTNAETGWIELTSQKFTPSLSSLFESFPLISARSIYEPLGISSPFQWKLRAFEGVIHEHCAKTDRNAVQHIISFGDSIHERDAAHQVCGKVSGSVCKSIKFMERPDISQLTKQHYLITECFEQIVSHQGTLDLCIQCQPPGQEVPI
jgi:hypothetical protein